MQPPITIAESDSCQHGPGEACRPDECATARVLAQWLVGHPWALSPLLYATGSRTRRRCLGMVLLFCAPLVEALWPWVAHPPLRRLLGRREVRALLLERMASERDAVQPALPAPAEVRKTA